MEEPDTSSFELVLLWLSQNQHLKFDERVRGVIEQLASTDSEMLLYIAAGSLVSLQESEHNLDHVEDNYPIETLKNNIALEFLSLKEKASQESGVHANKFRVEKYAVLKSDLKEYWAKNINVTKKATDAAVLLERTSIFIDSLTKVKRGVLEGYVRGWQKEPR
jgi:hypothetical protein